MDTEVEFLSRVMFRGLNSANSLVILEAHEHARLAHVAVADDYQLHGLYGHCEHRMKVRQITVILWLNVSYRQSFCFLPAL